MDWDSIKTSVDFELWVIPESNDSKIKNSFAVLKLGKSFDKYSLFQDETLISISVRDKKYQNDLNFYLKRGSAALTKIIQTADDGSALLQIKFFCGSVIEMGDVEIGLDEKIFKAGKHKYGPNKIMDKFKEACLIKTNEKSNNAYFIIMTGAATDDDYKNPLTEPVESQLRCFSVCGEDWRMPVEKRKINEQKEIDELKEIFFATKLIPNKNNNSISSLKLARGNISFADYTKTGRIKALAAANMTKLLNSEGSYLKKWDEYGAIEGDFLLANAKEIGKLEYSNVEQTDKGMKFYFDSELPAKLTNNDALEVTSEEPIYIENPDFTWKEYEEFLKENKEDKEDKIFAKIISLDSKSLVLDSTDINTIPSDDKFLILSINGDRIQIERRMKARELILKGESANPLLGMLIEENGEIPDIQRCSKLKPLTPFVRNKIFNNNPTETQKKAIEIALNTPDIALIQGPPGTGKTTVITAILERLNEEHDKTKSIRGEILVTGFQHDAVKNITDRLYINALPAVKFGKKLGESEYAEDKTRKKISKWTKEVAENIRKKNPQIEQSENQRKLSERFILYSTLPSLNNAITLLQLILELPSDILSSDLTKRTSELLNNINSELKADSQIEKTDQLKTIRALRITENGFKDDGKQRAADLIDMFEEQLDINDFKILKKAVVWNEKKKLNFLNNLKSIKVKLLDTFIPKPKFRIEKPRKDILELIDKVLNKLEKHKSRANKKDTILADFLHEIEDNPNGIRKTIEDYNYVFAATTQQTAGKSIRFAKTKNKDEIVKYDTVVVDEAARTSPRDLLIPMAQAEKRIILVGDHRQLPHIIDTEICNAMEKENQNDKDNELLNNDFINKSMFLYLFNRLKKLEQKDGFNRTVTLDAQFRTHPLLGDFISDNFYKEFDESFRSPLDETYFDHNLQDIKKKSAIWLDVKNNVGKEEKRGTSRCRPAEANAIADCLKKWIDSEEGKDLTFGVISFYKAQENLVKEALSKYNITKRREDNSWKISDKYNADKVRLRIGTVDSFQGMEFDVVFLSVVRSQNMDKLPHFLKNKDGISLKRSLFGHLMSVNRLCVSMSRQKKVLVVVGDSDFIQTDIAREDDAIPALGNYYDLCKSKGVIL